MDDLRHLLADALLHVAMDMEWPVDLANGIQGQVALVSMTYQKCVYLIQVSRYLRDSILHLPNTLLVLLWSIRIQKIGVHIQADLTHLFRDCGFKKDGNIPFIGAIELGAMVKN